MLWILLLICPPHVAKAHGALCLLPRNGGSSDDQLGSLARAAEPCDEEALLLAAESLHLLLSFPAHTVTLKSPFQVTNTGWLWNQWQGSRDTAGPLIAPGTERSARREGCSRLACVRSSCASRSPASLSPCSSQEPHGAHLLQVIVSTGLRPPKPQRCS